MRYFINVRDPISMGGSAHKAPRNVVYRSEGFATSAHKLAQWQGSSSYQEPIYHAPPETRVHAHKQALHLTKREEPDAERIPTEDVSDLVPDQGVRMPAPQFDFGDVENYDYGLL